MEKTKWNYYQFRRNLDYPVFVRFKEEESNSKFIHILQELGFGLVPEKECGKISLHKPSTKVLTVQNANARILQQINGSDALDAFGLEQLSIHGGVPIYTYRRVGVMNLPVQKTLTDLALGNDFSQTEQLVGLRITLIRFLAYALSDQGVLCYWGTVKDDSVVIMKQAQSFGEAVMIDLTKRMIFSNGGEMKLGSLLKIVRKDKETRIPSKMNREELISYLSVSQCLMSFSGVTPLMKKAIYELSAQATATYAVTDLSPNL